MLTVQEAGATLTQSCRKRCSCFGQCRTGGSLQGLFFLLFHFLFVFNKVRLHFQSKKSYEQRCKEADEAKQAAVKIGNAAAATATPKQTEKVH